MDAKPEIASVGLSRGSTLPENTAGWYCDLMEDFWSGHWDGSNAAFIFFAVFCIVLFGGMFLWRDILDAAVFAWQVVSQPIYGGALLVCVWRMRRRRRGRG